MEDYKKDLLFDLFESYEDYENIISALRSLNTENEITDDEYDYIISNYDELLDEWLKKQDDKQEVIDNIEDLKNDIRDEIINNISYDINGVYDKSMEEENRFITDIETLIDNDYNKARILINVIYHYINQYYDELDYRVFKNLEQNK